MDSFDSIRFERIIHSFDSSGAVRESATGASIGEDASIDRRIERAIDGSSERASDDGDGGDGDGGWRRGCEG